MAAKEAAELNAYNIETQKVVNDAEAVQRNNARIEQYSANLSANIAAFGAAGRDVGADRSVAAFLEKNKEVAGKDLQSSDFMAQMQAAKLTAEAAATRTEGRAAMASAVIGAFTSMASGINDYSKIKVDNAGD